MKIILDTNFLLIPAQFHIDIFSEIHRICDFRYRLCIFSGTLTELKKIMLVGKGCDKSAAKMALQMICKFDVQVLKSSRIVDDSIASLACREKIAVATQDKELRKGLKGKSRLIVMRGKSHLMLL